MGHLFFGKENICLVFIVEIRFPMRMLRRTINFILTHHFAKDDLYLRQLDNYILRFTGSLLKLFSIPGAQLLFKRSTLDKLHILFKSIAVTPYGQYLSLELPFIVTLSITDMCPFYCRFCFSSKKNSPPTHVSLDLVRNLASSRIPTFVLSGGEPMQHPKIQRIVEIFIASNKNLYIATHAPKSLLEPLAHLSGEKLTFILSIWGDNKTHDFYRGEGSFKRTIENAISLSKWKSRLAINFVLCEENPGLLNTLEAILNSISIYRVFITRPIFTDRASADLCSHSIGNIGSLFRRCKAIEQKTKVRISISIPEASIKVTQNLYLTLLSKAIGIPGIISKCAAGNWMMHVDSAGYFYPCLAFESKTAFGNLKDMDLQTAWKILKKETTTIGQSRSCPAERK
jgi:MoaA/NifB/PqqE/SkfB family radical SAM enzyme